MVKFLKSGKVVLVLNGRFAGRKAVIVKVGMACNSSRNFVINLNCNGDMQDHIFVPTILWSTRIY